MLKQFTAKADKDVKGLYRTRRRARAELHELGAQAALEALPHFRLVEKLDLAWNPLGSAGHLAVLPHCPAPRDLVLESTGDAEAIGHLAEVLPHQRLEWTSARTGRSYGKCVGQARGPRGAALRKKKKKNKK